MESRWGARRVGAVLSVVLGLYYTAFAVVATIRDNHGASSWSGVLILAIVPALACLVAGL